MIFSLNGGAESCMPRNHSFPKYYIVSAKTAFERNLSKKSSLKFLIEMNN